MTRRPTADCRPFRAARAAVLAGCLGLAMLAPAAARAGDAVRVQHPWFRYLLANIPAGGYLTLENAAAAPAVLTGASSPACGSLMLHRTESAGGIDRMTGVTQVTVPPHGQFAFTPGGYHLMCMQPKMTPGESVPVSLRFADGSRLTVAFPVRGADAAAPASGGTAKMKMGM